MASLRKKSGSRYYFACIVGADGRRTQVSTKETNRNRAQKVAVGLEEAGRMRASKFALLEKFNRISEDLYGGPMRVDSTRAYMETTIVQRQGEISASSARRYRQVANAFLDSLGPAADGPFRDVTFEQIVRFRNSIAERTSNSNGNTYIKCLRSFFTRALGDRVIMEDPTKRLRPLAKEKRAASEKRRPFTQDELNNLLKAAEETSQEWKWKIAIGLLTGQRLGDAATMHWSDIEFVGEDLAVWKFETSKTKRSMVLPLPRHIVDEIALSLGAKGPGSDAPVFPDANKLYRVAERTGTLSNQFADIMAKAGIQTKRDHKAHKTGRSRARAASKLGYHSLRYSVTTTLSNAGEARAVVMDLVGHDSVEMSHVYTTTELKQKVAAQAKLMPLLSAVVSQSKGAAGA